MDEITSFDEILNKLKALGVHQGADSLQPKPVQELLIDKVIDGYYDENEFGLTFIRDVSYDHTYQHGDVIFEKTREIKFDFLSKLSSINFSEYLINRTVFFDTETSGLSGGAGTFIFLCGYGYFTSAGFTLRQFFMPDPGSEQALLQSMDRFLSPFTVIISFNGKSFDEPLMNNRYRMYGCQSALSGKQHFDMLNVARKLWKLRLPSRALKDLEVEILNLRRSSEEIPGYMVPEIYSEYLFSKDATPLAGVFYHNAMDILSLAALTLYVGKALDEIDSDILLPAEDMYSIAVMCANDDQLNKTYMLLKKCINNSENAEICKKSIILYATLHKKTGDFKEAITYWEIAAQQYGDWESAVELAKYYEHKAIDYHSAIEWAELAEKLLYLNEMSKYNNNIAHLELNKRLARLADQINRNK